MKVCFQDSACERRPKTRQGLAITPTMNLLDVCCTVTGYLQRSAAAVRNKFEEATRSKFRLIVYKVVFCLNKVTIMCRLPRIICVKSNENKQFAEHEGK